MIEFTLENDLLWTDRAYTNGVRLRLHDIGGLHVVPSWIGIETPRCATQPAKSAPAVVTCLRSSVAIQQTMYTPTNQYADSLQLLDRPFAGLLLGATRWELIHRRFVGSGKPHTWLGGDVTFGVEGQLGVMGPTAQARETQRMAHFAVGPNVPMDGSTKSGIAGMRKR